MAESKKLKKTATPSTNGHATIAGTSHASNGVSHAVSAPTRSSKIATVSHTLDSEIAERLRYFAFRERISESAIIEYALRSFLASGDEAALGQQLRDAGAALRRKS